MPAEAVARHASRHEEDVDRTAAVFGEKRGALTMRTCTAIALALLVSMPVPFAGAEAPVPDGTWLISQRVAVDVFSCQNALCARVAWLRNPGLRTSEMCSRTIIWGLTSEGPAQWGNGWFFDPEDGHTYNVSAHVETIDRISARIYKGWSLLGRTEILTRIAPHSLPGWCEPLAP